MMDTNDDVPTGQGLRIKISIESTNPPRLYQDTGFVSFDKRLKHKNVDRRVEDALKEVTSKVQEMFEQEFSSLVKGVYYPNQIK